MNKDKQILFEQYKLYVESAEKVSDRRQSSNNFFLTLNSTLLAFTGFLTSLSLEYWHIITGVTGVCISLLWLLTLKSFRSLNSGKFQVIHCLEDNLPYKLFKEEWKCLGNGNDKRKYLKLSIVEQGVPILFMILYAVVIILMLIK